MAIAVNLTPIQQKELEDVFSGFKKTNEAFDFRFFTQITEVNPKIEVRPEPKQESNLEEKIDQLNRKLDLIFGNHVFIDGKLVPIK